MKFTILSRQSAEFLLASRPDSQHIVISISTPGCPPAHLTSTNTILGVLRLWFADLDHLPDELSELKTRLFQPEDARAILRIVQDHVDEVEEVIIHCDAGMSRSPGVAAALSRVFTGDDREVFKSFPHLNRFVYRTIINEFYGSPESV